MDKKFLYKPSYKEVSSMRHLTGLGMMECKELLIRFKGDLEECIKVMRATSDEPNYNGPMEGRIDILNEKGEVVFTCTGLEEADKGGYDYFTLISPQYKIRGVDCFGRYREIQLK